MIIIPITMLKHEQQVIVEPIHISQTNEIEEVSDPILQKYELMVDKPHKQNSLFITLSEEYNKEKLNKIFNKYGVIKKDVFKPSETEYLYIEHSNNYDTRDLVYDLSKGGLIQLLVFRFCI